MPAGSKTLRGASALVEAQLIKPERLAALKNVASRYAVAITPAVTDLIDTADPHDPIALQFVPDERGNLGRHRDRVTRRDLLQIGNIRDGHETVRGQFRWLP